MTTVQTLLMQLIQKFMYIYEVSFVPQFNSEIEINLGGATGIVRYEVTTVQSTTEFVSSNYQSGTVYKVNLATPGTDSTSTTGLKAAPANGTIGVLRANLTHTFNGVESESPKIRSALVFDPLPAKFTELLILELLTHLVLS